MAPTTRRQSVHSTTSSDVASSAIDLTSSPEPSAEASRHGRKRAFKEHETRQDGSSSQPTSTGQKRARRRGSGQSQNRGPDVHEHISQLSHQSHASSSPPWRQTSQVEDNTSSSRARSNIVNVDDVEEVDLTSNDAGDLGAALQKQRSDQIAAQKPQEEQSKLLRFSNITCVICMDTPTDLTATSCGHIFCHTCLMEALIAGESRGGPGEPKRSQCPVCRKNISRKKTADIIPLLLKKGFSNQPRRKENATGGLA